MIWTYGFKKGRERVYFLNEHKRDLLNKSTSTFLLNRILYRSVINIDITPYNKNFYEVRLKLFLFSGGYATGLVYTPP